VEFAIIITDIIRIAIIH